jgi:hypothetical protein
MSPILCLTSLSQGKEIQPPFDSRSRACPSASEMPRLRSVLVSARSDGHLPNPHYFLVCFPEPCTIIFADYQVT